jgi:hypothetical protein
MRNAAAIQKVETNCIYSTLRCTNSDTLVATTNGELLMYMNFDVSETLLYQFDEQIAKICSSTGDQTFVVSTLSGKLLQVSDDGGSPVLLHQGHDFLVGNVEYDDNCYWYVLPHGEDLIARHFKFMKLVTSEKLSDVRIIIN